MSDILPNLCWVDLETTGLNPTEDLLLEIAVVITDADLQVLASHEQVFYHDITINNLDPKIFKMHSENGLFYDMLQMGGDVEKTEAELVAIMLSTKTRPIGCKTKPPLCGSSINFERDWLKVWMPKFYDKLHYRSIDVSSIKELMRRWDPVNAITSAAVSQHRAMGDIMNSIEELKWYRSVLWNSTSPLDDTVSV